MQSLNGDQNAARRNQMYCRCGQQEIGKSTQGHATVIWGAFAWNQHCRTCERSLPSYVTLVYAAFESSSYKTCVNSGQCSVSIAGFICQHRVICDLEGAFLRAVCEVYPSGPGTGSSWWTSLGIAVWIRQVIHETDCLELVSTFFSDYKGRRAHVHTNTHAHAHEYIFLVHV